ncbi:MAG: histidine triad nucleotide-binding protein [Clostridia bacterium]|nr:histidine triad nucleotide-binding protein [Clostridia bacterium]
MVEKDCVFCKIVAGELPSEIVYEDDDILAFKDINPVAPVHILLIPKKHIPTITDIEEEDAALMGKLLLAAGKVADKMGIFDRGFRLVNNCREEGGQMVYHLHFHLLGGKQFGSVG